MGLAGVFRSIRLLFTRIGEFKALLLLVQRPLPLSTVGFSVSDPPEMSSDRVCFSLLLLLLPLFPHSSPPPPFLLFLMRRGKR